MVNDSRHPFSARLRDWPDPRLGAVLDRRVDRQLRYFDAQLAMDRAHTVMLCEQEIISASEAADILRVLGELSAGGRSALQRRSARSSLFWYVEARLVAELGEHIGGKMHTGRSHNDIMPTVSRLTARSRLLDVVAAVIALRGALLRRAGEHVEVVMPGYTALQHGQPWTFGHYLAGWSPAFGRDIVRLRHAYENVNRSPLGASALAGTSWPLDRDRVAELLGFDGILRHSRDAGFGTRDYVMEILAAIAIMMTNLNSLCSDLYLWSSYEFGLVEIADGFSGTSSFMPQKKNAWAVDWTRGAAGTTIGALVASLAATRGTSSTDGALQDYPEEPLAEAFDTAIEYVDLVTGVIDSLKANAPLMLERAQANWTTASNLADVIARECDLSFRAAHGIVGGVVRLALEREIAPLDVTAAMVDEVAGRGLGLSDERIHDALDPIGFIASRVTAGSVHPDQTRALIEEGASDLAAQHRWLDERRGALEVASQRLLDAVAVYRKH